MKFLSMILFIYTNRVFWLFWCKFLYGINPSPVLAVYTCFHICILYLYLYIQIYIYTPVSISYLYLYLYTGWSISLSTFHIHSAIYISLQLYVQIHVCLYPYVRITIHTQLQSTSEPTRIQVSLYICSTDGFPCSPLCRHTSYGSSSEQIKVVLWWRSYSF